MARKNKHKTARFGSKAWLSRALLRKYKGSPSNRRGEILSVTDYVMLLKASEIANEYHQRPKRVTWIDDPAIFGPDANELPPEGDTVQ